MTQHYRYSKLFGAMLALFVANWPMWPAYCDDEGITAEEPTALESYLQRLDENPTEVANEKPQKFDENGNAIKQAESAFSERDINSRDYVTGKDMYREKLCMSLTRGFQGNTAT